MLNIRCPNCQIVAEVADGQEGALVRCPQCDSMIRVPLVEKQEGYGVGAETEEAPRPQVVKDYVKKLEKDARRKIKEASGPGYQREARPVGVIVGWICVTTGVLFLIVAILNFNDSPMTSLIRGVLPALIFFLIGAMCLMAR